MKYLTREEIAEELRVHVRTVERWLRKGMIKGYKLGEGRTSLWRIPEIEFKKFLDKNKNIK